MNVIFGSGIIGLLAKLILGSSWKVIPFYRSRFFSYNPALDDNFITYDDELEPFIKELTKEIKPRQFIYRRAWSINGHLLSSWDNAICDDWLHKIFGNDKPPQSSIYYKDKMDLHVYDIRVNELYENLVNMFMPDLKSEAALGSVTEIGDHYFIRNGIKENFDKAISTIPLDALCKLMRTDVSLPARDIHYLHIKTSDLDFESYNQLFVVDPLFDFFKVSNIAPERYMIYCHNEILNPGPYLMNFIRKFDIIEGTSIKNAIPMGHMPNLSAVDNIGITCVGSCAQWDWCMDVGSCILKLLRYANRGNKPGSNLIEIKA